MTEEQLADFLDYNPNKNRNGNSNGNGKENAAQKRQSQRDDRRSREDPDRDEHQEARERARKTKQSEDRGRSEVDPYSGDGNRDYDRKREATRITKCERTGRNCNYSGPNSLCYDDCLGDLRNTRQNERCARECQFIDARCYDNCRFDGGTVAQCLDDCQDNIDDDVTQDRIRRRANRDDYDSIDDCEADCRSIGNDRKRELCYLSCD